MSVRMFDVHHVHSNPPGWSYYEEGTLPMGLSCLVSCLYICTRHVMLHPLYSPPDLQGNNVSTKCSIRHKGCVSSKKVRLYENRTLHPPDIHILDFITSQPPFLAKKISFPDISHDNLLHSGQISSNHLLPNLPMALNWTNIQPRKLLIAQNLLGNLDRSTFNTNQKKSPF